MGSTWRTIEMLRLGLVISHLMGGVLSLTPPVVQIGNGKLQGTYYRTFNDREVLAFLGVPFAEPPVGNMRFRPPLPVRGWEGMRVANDTRAPCLQYNHYLSAIGRKPIIGQEDCLYLDVYTPRLQTDRLMEVVVFVHGGAFTYGSRSGFNPKYLLAEKELVLVVISYRVGPFGFLSTGDEVVPGNMGMKDQTEALRWVNRNIDKFGGDPDKVTLAGLSAGGASVHFHYFSPESRRYFKQGISLSGTALCPWALMESPEQKTTILANAVGCPTNTTSIDTIDCLRDRPGELILYRMHSTLMPWLFNPISPFAPTIENSPSQRPFLVDHPEKLLREGKVYDAPWLVGFTSGEGFYPASEFVLDERLMSDLNNNWTIIAPHLLDFNFTEPDSNLRTAKSIKIKDHYLKGSHFLTRDSTLDVIEMVSDRMYLSAIDKAVRLQAKVNKSPVYVYNFAYRGRNTLWEQFAGMKTDMGAGHGDDVAYVLGAYFSCTDSDDDRKMVDTMVGVWSSYAKNSQPASVAGETWTPQVGDKNVSYLLIESSERASMESSNHLGNTHFWDTLLSAELASSTRHDEF